MRIVRNNIKPTLECLEDRWVPATILAVGGNLYISNLLGGTGLTVETTATPGQINVTDNGNLTSVNGITGLISITGTSNADQVTVNLGANSFAGSILANLGNGNDSFQIAGAGGTLGGNLTVLTGTGDDTVRLNRPSSGAGTLKISGSTLLADTTGNDTLNIGNNSAVTTLGGNLTASNFNTISMGTGQSDVYGGSISFMTVTDGLPLSLNQGNLGGSEVSPVGGDFTITAGAADDSVTLRGLVIGRNLNMNLGGATVQNRAVLNSSANSVTTVNGNLTYQGGAGADYLDFGGATVNGDVRLTLGDGNNTLLLNDFGPNPGTKFNGNFNLDSGSGTLAASIGARIAGSAVVYLAGGTNTVTFTNTNTLGGKLIFRTSGGNTTLNLNGAENYILDAVFGGGNDTVVLNNPMLVLSGQLFGGSGTNTLSVLAGTIAPGTIIVGF